MNLLLNDNQGLSKWFECKLLCKRIFTRTEIIMKCYIESFNTSKRKVIISSEICVRTGTQSFLAGKSEATLIIQLK